MAFPPAIISVVQGSKPVLSYRLSTFRDENAPSGIVDITGYVFELIVRTVEAGEEVFRLTGEIVSASSGTFKFNLTPEHTFLTPDDYEAELRWFVPPDAPTTAPVDNLAGAGAGNVDNGLHTYMVTFVGPEGESEGSPVSAGVTVADKTVDGKVAVSSIPVGPTGTLSRKLFRTVAGGTGDHKLVTTISGNVTTTYEDNTADASLGDALAAAADDEWYPFDAVVLPYQVELGAGR